MTPYDYLMMLGYLAFMPIIGLIFKRMSANASDFYRGGGSIQWWLAGASIVVASFSAFSFTGGAAKAYHTGFVLPLGYMTAIVGLIPLYLFLAARFRQMRVVTVCEAVRRRYGKTTEQFWVWTQSSISVFYSGLGLMTVSIFIGSALGVDIQICIIALGLAVLLMTVAGGEWSVQSSDFLQLSIIITVCTAIVWRSLSLPEIGGIGGLIEKMPSHYWNWSEFARPAIVGAWLGTFVFFNLVNSANVSSVGARYLAVRDGRHARRAVLMQIAGTLIMPVLFFVPAYVAAVLFTDMDSIFPHLTVPAEGAYLAVAFEVLPAGLLGLMVCCVFAATMSTLDTGLNRTSGFFVVNLYKAYINPEASPARQLKVGRCITLGLGVAMISIALLLNAYRQLNLFDFVILLGALIATPQIVPMVLGMFIRRTPGWSGWSTVLVGLATSFAIHFFADMEVIAGWFGIDAPLNAVERADVRFVVITFITLAVSLSYYLSTMFFYKADAPAKGADTDAYFEDMKRPIDHERELTPDNAHQQSYLIAITLIAFGSFTLLGLLIPNTLADRLLFVYIGGSIVLLGAFFMFYSKRLSANRTPQPEVI